MPISDAATAATTLCCWTASTIRCSSRDSCRCLSRSARFLIRPLPGDEADGPLPPFRLVAVATGPGGSLPLAATVAALVGSPVRDDADGCAGGAVTTRDDDDDLVLDLDDDLERTDEALPLPLLPMLRDEDALIPAEDEDVRLLPLLLLLVLLVLLLTDEDAAVPVALWRTYDAVAILPLGSTLAERVRLELRRRVPLALRAAARCVAEVGVDIVDVEGEGDFNAADRPRLLLLPLLPMASFLSLRRRGDLPPPALLLVRMLPPDGSGSGGGASFSPSERYMLASSEIGRRLDRSKSYLLTFTLPSLLWQWHASMSDCVRLGSASAISPYRQHTKN